MVSARSQAGHAPGKSGLSRCSHSGPQDTGGGGPGRSHMAQALVGHGLVTMHMEPPRFRGPLSHSQEVSIAIVASRPLKGVQRGRRA